MVVDIEVEGEVKGDSEEDDLDKKDQIMDGKRGTVVKTGKGKFIEDNSEQMYKNSEELI